MQSSSNCSHRTTSGRAAAWSTSARNAEGQGWPSPGPYLRHAIPDRVDVIEDVIAEGDKVGLLFRLTGTHRANFFGIPATGRKIDVYEAAILRIVNGRITEGWFMADEAGLLKQIGAKLPPRKDGHVIVPPITKGGEDPDEVLKRLQASPACDARRPASAHRRAVEIVQSAEGLSCGRLQAAASGFPALARLRQCQRRGP